MWGAQEEDGVGDSTVGMPLDKVFGFHASLLRPGQHAPEDYDGPVR
jgi:hypothetical protein